MPKRKMIADEKAEGNTPKRPKPVRRQKAKDKSKEKPKLKQNKKANREKEGEEEEEKHVNEKEDDDDESDIDNDSGSERDEVKTKSKVDEEEEENEENEENEKENENEANEANAKQQLKETDTESDTGSEGTGNDSDSESESESEVESEVENEEEEEEKEEEKEKSNDNNAGEKKEDENEEEKEKGKEKAKEKEKETKQAKAKKAPKAQREKKSRRKPMSMSTFRIHHDPYHLLDPVMRKTIWKNLMLMMERRGYTWIRDRPDPTDTEQLSIAKIKGYLGMFHMHAEHPQREPVYVVLFSKSGEPALKQLVYPSRHVIVLTDATTGKARNAMKAVINQKNFTATLAKAKAKQEGGSVVYSMHDVHMESHTSEAFCTDIMSHRYLETNKITLATEADRKQVADLFESDIMKYPLIPDSDPISRYFGYRPGDVLKEKCLSTTAGMTHSFRTVVPAKGK